MISGLIKWLITILVIAVIGTAIGWAIPIVVAAASLWALVVVVMVAAIAVFKFAVWAIRESDYM